MHMRGYLCTWTIPGCRETGRWFFYLTEKVLCVSVFVNTFLFHLPWPLFLCSWICRCFTKKHQVYNLQSVICYKIYLCINMKISWSSIICYSHMSFITDFTEHLLYNFLCLVVNPRFYLGASLFMDVNTLVLDIKWNTQLSYFYQWLLLPLHR